MHIDQREKSTFIYPLNDEKDSRDKREYIEIKRPSGVVIYSNILWTEAMFEKLTAAFAKAFELAKAAREITDAKK